VSLQIILLPLTAALEEIAESLASSQDMTLEAIFMVLEP